MSLQTFTCFPDPSKELRLAIWELVITSNLEARRIEVYLESKSPTVLNINSESREVALRITDYVPAAVSTLLGTERQLISSNMDCLPAHDEYTTPGYKLPKTVVYDVDHVQSWYVPWGIDLKIWNSSWECREWKEFVFVLHQFDGRGGVEIALQKEIQTKKVYSQSKRIESGPETGSPIILTIRKCEGQCEESRSCSTKGQAYCEPRFWQRVYGTFKLDLPLKWNMHGWVRSSVDIIQESAGQHILIRAVVYLKP
jgi:hypothetical protein